MTITHPSLSKHTGEALTSLQRSCLITTLLLDPPVSPERVTSRETFAANLADVRLVSGMNPAVPLQIVLARKGTRADGTGERFELRVRAKVGFEVVGAVLGKSLVAVGIGAFGDSVNVDACVHGVAEGVDHIGCVRVHAVVGHEARGRVVHAVAV